MTDETQTKKTAAKPETPNSLRVELAGALDGEWIAIDRSRLTMGVLEDLYGSEPKQLIDSVASCLVAGSLDYGVSRAGLRELTRDQFAVITNAVAEAYRVPNTVEAPGQLYPVQDSSIAGVLNTLHVIPHTDWDKRLAIEADGEEYIPGYVYSYRGDHADACVYTPYPGNPGEANSIDKLSRMLEDSVGSRMTGWKGGEYNVDRHRPLWFANEEGTWPGWSFIRIRVEDDRVVLETRRDS